MAIPLVLGIIGTLVLLILLIRTRMGLQDRSFRFVFVLLLLMCIFAIGLAACDDYSPPGPGGPGCCNSVPTQNPLIGGTPVLPQSNPLGGTPTSP